MIKELFFSKPFVIGVFYGKSKPDNLDFFKDFIDEYTQLHSVKGLIHNSYTLYVSVSSIVCDAPGRALLKNIKLYSGYSGCEQCTQKEQWKNKMTYPDLNASLRTDSSFNEILDKSHPNGPTLLAISGINLVSDMVLDYLHLVCLGVIRKLLMLWISGPFCCRQSYSIINSVSDCLLQIKSSVPSEFVWQPKSLNEVKHWKATEFR